MMQYTAKFKLNLLLALWCWSTTVSGQVTSSAKEDNLIDKLWDAVGGQENWQNARYFMFSCTGGHPSFAQGERKYLWDKRTGNCRFDGMTTDDERITVLLNIETGKGTVYIGNTKLENPRTTGDVITEITEEFNRDAQLLFLPTILEGDQVSYHIVGEKLIGSQRFTVVNVSNKLTEFETSVTGQLYVDSQTGQIHQWRPGNGSGTYSIDDYKVIGSGLLLPTHFDSGDTATSVSYPIAAALTYIEGEKFNKP